MTTDVEVTEIGDGQITCEGNAIRCAGRLLWLLQPGDTWTKLLDRRGVIVTHPDTSSHWVKLENGVVRSTPVTPDTGIEKQ